MNDKEKQIIGTFAKVIPGLSDGAKEYLLGVGDGMAIMAAMQGKETTTPTESTKSGKE